MSISSRRSAAALLETLSSLKLFIQKPTPCRQITLYNGEYNGTLVPCIINIQDSIDYKAGDPMKDSISLLILIEEIKCSAFLFRADMVVVCKRGFHMIRLVNKAQPKSGRSIYIEVNSCRNDLFRMTQLTVGREVLWPTIVIAVGVIVSAALLVLKK